MGPAGPTHRRLNTLATLQHSSGRGSSAERQMMGQQMPPQFLGEESLLHLNDSDVIVPAGYGPPGQAAGMPGAPWMSNIASNQ